MQSGDQCKHCDNDCTDRLGSYRAVDASIGTAIKVLGAFKEANRVGSSTGIRVVYANARGKRGSS